MSTIDKATKIMAGIIGDSSSRHFGTQAEEMIWYAKSLSMDPSKAGSPPTIDRIKRKFEKIAHNVISSSVELFLADKYNSFTVTKDFKVLDQNMKPIREIDDIRDKQVEVTSILVDLAMNEFVRGRVIAEDIVARVKAKMAGKVSGNSRNYASSPPFEEYEIALMRLERKLPFISREDGRRLSELYDLMHSSCPEER